LKAVAHGGLLLGEVEKEAQEGKGEKVEEEGEAVV
jgi:hypothetical protein